MYQQLSQNLYLVHNAIEFNELWDDRFPIKVERPANYIPDELELLYPQRTQLLADYPILVCYKGDELHMPDIVPVAKAIGGLGNIRQLNMRDAFNNFMRACKDAVPFHQPRILLTGITIKPRTVPVGYFAHVHPTHNPDLMDAIASLGKHDAKLKALRIQFGDGQFHGSVEMKEEMMFVTQVRDITDQIAKVGLDNNTGKYTAEYIFNHYDFFNTTPELQGYKDMTKWDVAVTTSIQYTLDNGK